MDVTAAELNRATLHRQLLLRREPLTVPEAVRRVVAVQAQEPASPYLALWNRVDPFGPADLDAAFAERTVLKATLLRATLHAVHAGDHPAFHAAMADSLRGARVADARFTGSGLTAADTDALLPDLLAHAASPRTKVDFEALFADRLGGPPEPRLWWALKTYAPITHAPTGGPWSYGPKAAFLAAPAVEPDRERAVQRLVRRYLEGFGPASAADFARFTRLGRGVARAALAAQPDLRTLTGPDGTELYDVPDGVVPAADTPAPPRLMAMWDSVLLAYGQSRVVPTELRAVVTRVNGDVLPTLLVDGLVAGVWRAVDGGIEATAYRPLPDAAWDGLATEARALVAFLADRDPAVYRRYAHWWSKLAPGETRLLATRAPR